MITYLGKLKQFNLSLILLLINLSHDKEALNNLLRIDRYHILNLCKKFIISKYLVMNM